MPSTKEGPAMPPTSLRVTRVARRRPEVNDVEERRRDQVIAAPPPLTPMPLMLASLTCDHFRRVLARCSVTPVPEASAADLFVRDVREAQRCGAVDRAHLVDALLRDLPVEHRERTAG
jgi:hypothetical protein